MAGKAPTRSGHSKMSQCFLTLPCHFLTNYSLCHFPKVPNSFLLFKTCPQLLLPYSRGRLQPGHAIGGGDPQAHVHHSMVHIFTEGMSQKHISQFCLVECYLSWRGKHLEATRGQGRLHRGLIINKAQLADPDQDEGTPSSLWPLFHTSFGFKL